jgi:hypothetical protein
LLFDEDAGFGDGLQVVNAKHVWPLGLNMQRVSLFDLRHVINNNA